MKEIIMPACATYTHRSLHTISCRKIKEALYFAIWNYMIGLHDCVFPQDTYLRDEVSIFVAMDGVAK